VAQHDDLAHREIIKAKEAFGSDRTEPPSGADRIIIVLDLVLQRMDDMNGNRRSKVKKHGPPVAGGMGFMAVIFEVLRIVA